MLHSSWKESRFLLESWVGLRHGSSADHPGMGSKYVIFYLFVWNKYVISTAVDYGYGSDVHGIKDPPGPSGAQDRGHNAKEVGPGWGKMKTTDFEL